MSFDTVQENLNFKNKFNFPFQLLCDTERTIGMAYGACADAKTKHASRIGYLIDAAGKIRKAYPSVDAKQFPEQALADLP